MEASIKQMITDAGHGGGYIVSPCTDLTDSCKFENSMAMIGAVKRWGKYSLEV